jgi:hypothetical protein
MSEQGWTPPIDPVIKPTDEKHPAKRKVNIRIRTDVFSALQDLELAACVLGATPTEDRQAVENAYAALCQRRRELYELLEHPLSKDHPTTLVK